MLNMSLNKFPVVGELEEYEVAVTESYEFIPTMTVYIYRRTPERLFSKRKRLACYSTDNYEKFIGHYVDLAKCAVRWYEGKVKKERARNELHEKGLKEFDVWNGKLN